MKSIVAIVAALFATVAFAGDAPKAEAKKDEKKAEAKKVLVKEAKAKTNVPLPGNKWADHVVMVHPETKQMVMVPMQDIQYQRQGSTEWFSMPLVELEKHEFNPEEKPTGIITNEG